jgi:hypothetical protein
VTVPPAALPGHNLAGMQAPTEYRDHPGNDRPLCCPSCGHADQLVASYPVVATAPVLVQEVDAATRPEVEPGSGVEYTEPADLTMPAKIACRACRWAYTGPDPLARLLPEVR